MCHNVSTELLQFDDSNHGEGNVKGSRFHGPYCSTFFSDKNCFLLSECFFCVGTIFYYTTHGWTLLSAVIEGVSGMPFLDYLQKFILSPLHMDGTGPETNNSSSLQQSKVLYVVW